ncbi:hypothetical protein ATCV1_z458R [Acanthocystis turfacea chlorella virus 1]|uniref:Uncharacterized protein z458R n=1 Tax=Chlorovirus heliozoae TaxID=322019 RepID=A7K968_9PHYC|nr:hypothetical protein ATCV1_z458R [Acanthocystis turfacea chlorella virus 1]ABT16592.1 hypothetical protein ATCV1_z458R [Acanthocystis turfacea chlorella virus 1]
MRPSIEMTTIVVVFQKEVKLYYSVSIYSDLESCQVGVQDQAEHDRVEEDAPASGSISVNQHEAISRSNHVGNLVGHGVRHDHEHECREEHELELGGNHY